MNFFTIITIITTVLFIVVYISLFITLCTLKNKNINTETNLYLNLIITFEVFFFILFVLLFYFFFYSNYSDINVYKESLVFFTFLITFFILLLFIVGSIITSKLSSSGSTLHSLFPIPSRFITTLFITQYIGIIFLTVVFVIPYLSAIFLTLLYGEKKSGQVYEKLFDQELQLPPQKRRSSVRKSGEWRLSDYYATS
jgi:hypothetical protein